jgi:hypothetical protein
MGDFVDPLLWDGINWNADAVLASTPDVYKQ